MPRNLSPLAVILFAASVVAQRPPAPSPPERPVEKARADRQQSVSSEPRVLLPTSIRLVEAPPEFAFTNSDCDEAGTLYLHTGIQGSYRDPILRLSTTGNFKFFKPTADDTNVGAQGAMSVSPDGTLWLLLSGAESAVLVRFNSDGEVTTRTKIDQFARLVVEEFVAFNNDVFFIAGFPRPMEADQKMTRYAAVVNSSGQLVSVPKLDLPKFDTQSKKIAEGGAAAGSDGNLYLLNPEEMVVVSQAGEVLRHLRFRKPSADFSTVNVSISGGLAAIWFIKPVEQHLIATELLVLDAVSGKEVGRYSLGPELEHRNPLCFSRQDGFTFLGEVQHGKMKLITAALR